MRALRETQDPREAGDVRDGDPDRSGPTAEEVALIEAARSGDDDAARTLVELHERRIFGMVRRTLNCDAHTAADLSQEVFLRAFRRLDTFDSRAKFSTWLYKIALNVCISDYRKRRAQKRDRWTFSLDAPSPDGDERHFDPEGDAPSPDDRAHHQEAAAAIRAAIAELPEDFRSAIVLRDLHGVDYSEIATILDVPIGTVRSRIHRGRLQLQKRLEQFRP